MSNTRHKARRAAVQAIYQWQLSGTPCLLIQNEFIEEHDMRGADIEYFKELITQVPQRTGELDDHMSSLLDRSINSVDPVERAILRLGVYELQYRLEIPFKVVINEGVELAKVFGAEHGHKYVNSILDGVARKLRSAEQAAPAK